jgi:hypothetical protein
VIASEFAFLALGLVLGVATGAALIEVLRARPPAAREIRVTVAPNSIHARRSATLAENAFSPVMPGPAVGGPADRSWIDADPEIPDPVAPGRRIEDRLLDFVAPGDRAAAGRTSVRRDVDVAAAAAGRAPDAAQPIPGPPFLPGPIWPSPATVVAASSGLVAVPMSMEPDPITAALRATAARVAVAAMGSASSRRAEPAADESPAKIATTDGSLTGGGSGTEPCAEERRVADERCSMASRAREGASGAAEALRVAQRAYDQHVGAAESHAAAIDPRSVRGAKESAQARFRDARTSAATRDEVEAAARTWLGEINQINHDTREAARYIDRDRASAVALVPVLERLAVEADAARILAERADEACLAAREAVVACDEARTMEAVESTTAPAGGPVAGQVDRPVAVLEDELEPTMAMGSRAGEDAVLLRILRGDREAMLGAVARLSGGDTDARRRWQTWLSDLAEALIARSIEASAFDFPLEHPFWGPFSQLQNRDIAAGLSSLGYRFDGFGGWVDEHVPAQRDLSLAVSYSGLDPMRIRRWPTEAEMRDLFAEVRVAADEYVAEAAGSLTLGEMVSLLGRRADALTELWNEWGTARPILLGAG